MMELGLEALGLHHAATAANGVSEDESESRYGMMICAVRCYELALCQRLVHIDTMTFISFNNSGYNALCG